MRALVNGTVYLMDQPESTANAILFDKRVQKVGTTEEIQAAAHQAGAHITDLQGKVVIPGFVDAHTHFLHVGVKGTRPDLSQCTSMAEALTYTTAWLQEHPGGPVIGEGFDEGDWPEKRWPTKEEVNQAVRAAGPDRPFVFRRICGHIAIANDLALQAIWKNWPRADIVDMETGVLLEEASLYLNEVIPSTPDQLDIAVQAACRRAHELGVTSVGDYSQAPYRAALQRAAAAGTLTVRTVSSVYVQQLDDEVALGMRTGQPGAGPGDATADWTAMPAGEWTPEHPGVLPAKRTEGTSGFLQDGGLKVFLDGSLGARTALLRDDYSDEPGNKGKQNWSNAQVAEYFQKAHESGIQLHAHAIGDGAIDQGLDGFAPLHEADPTGFAALRHRFEHYEIVHDDQIQRSVDLEIVASSQPNFVGEWSAPGGMYHDRLGDRCPVNNRFVSFRRAGLRLAFGSDGMPFGPLVGLQAALHHPEVNQRLTPEEAIWHYTNEAAWSLHLEDLGQLTPGAHADLLILDQTALDDQPLAWEIAETVVAGISR